MESLAWSKRGHTKAAMLESLALVKHMLFVAWGGDTTRGPNSSNTLATWTTNCKVGPTPSWSHRLSDRTGCCSESQTRAAWKPGWASGAAVEVAELETEPPAGGAHIPV